MYRYLYRILISEGVNGEVFCDDLTTIRDRYHLDQLGVPNLKLGGLDWRLSVCSTTYSLIVSKHRLVTAAHDSLLCCWRLAFL